MLTRVEEYAIKLVADGIESTAEDDLDEDGFFTLVEKSGHEKAVELALNLAAAIRSHPRAVLDYLTQLPVIDEP